MDITTGARRRSVLGRGTSVPPVRLTAADLAQLSRASVGQGQGQGSQSRTKTGSHAQPSNLKRMSFAAGRNTNSLVSKIKVSKPCENVTSLPIRVQSQALRRRLDEKFSDSSQSIMEGVSSLSQSALETISTPLSNIRVSSDTTATFKEIERALQTSTPRPERDNVNPPVQSMIPSNASSCSTSCNSSQEILKEIKSIAISQRETADTLKEVLQEMRSFNTLLSAHLKPNQDCESSNVEKMLFASNKENVSLRRPRKSVSAYADLQSNLNCLRTPNAQRSTIPSIETPRTKLSNTIQNQLETLLDVSETDE